MDGNTEKKLNRDSGTIRNNPVQLSDSFRLPSGYFLLE